ncbi:MAG TPA: tetratricopeptide repeat protein [Chthoniobacterales bacterium]|jgi:CHAT domain-containing protein/Flp pilus assembly protein TadD|nr:tetratricopeptide repeat protein [Chthoniobacterales bacterium]
MRVLTALAALISLQASAREPSPEIQAELAALDLQVSRLESAGLYSQAVPIATKLFKLREKTLGAEHADTAASLNMLGFLHDRMGDYAVAAPLYQRSLQIREKVLGPDHPDTATSLNNLAFLYYTMGDYKQAEPLYLRSLKVSEKALGPEHSNTAVSINNLALLYYQTGDLAKAEPLLQRALEIIENVLGPEHPHTATGLNNLAGLYRKAGDYAKAEPLFQRSLKIMEEAVGAEHPDTATTLNNLGGLYQNMGDYTKAERYFQRTIKIREKTLGPDHPDIAVSLNSLALLYAVMGRRKEALELAARDQRAQKTTLANILSFTSEEQRLAFQKTASPYDLPATLESAPQLAEIALRRKGVVLDSLLEDQLLAQASEDPQQRRTIDKVRTAKQRLMQLLFEAPPDNSEKAIAERDAEKRELSKLVEELESSLARRVAGLGRARRALSVTVKQVQAALQSDEALVELLRYDHYLGRDKFEARYGAVLMTPRSEPKWVPFGSAEEIERSVHLYKRSARGETNQPTLEKALRALHAQLWEPIQNALPDGTKTIIVSPDAELSFLSFATLLGVDDKFVAQNYFIRYVASGRDLLRDTKSTANEQMVVYADADFGSKSALAASDRAASTARRSTEMRNLQSISLRPLPGSAAEAAALEKRDQRLTKLFVQANATERALRKVDSPRVLHMATHGFFLPEVDLGNRKSGPLDREQQIPKSKLVNPMYRSGLALSGAQTTLQAWASGIEPPLTENDGIVTAEEVGGLKLNGTWLVVLSACDTGSGEAKAGEGVMGLRRGFAQAGTQNLLMTLWPISDTTTIQIMLDFYDTAFRTGNASQALAQTQRDWLVKLRKEKGLLAAVSLAGPFIMSSQGGPARGPGTQ